MPNAQPDDLIGLAFDRSPLASTPLGRRYLAPLPPLRTPALRPDVLRVARRAWEDRTRAEYVGVMIMRKLHGLLVDHGAPMDLQELALVMVLHEQRHAALCAHCAHALGSDGEIAFGLGELQQRARRAPGPELLDMVIGTLTIGEGVARGLLAWTVRTVPASGFRGVLQSILRDERLHAGIGPGLLDQLRRGGWAEPPTEAAVEAAARDAVRTLRQRDVVEPDELELAGDPEARAQLASVGVPAAAAFRAAYHRAVDRAARDQAWNPLLR